MQHWTLCECLLGAHVQFGDLHFVTTHSMSPWALPERKEAAGICRTTFLRAGKRLGTIKIPSQFEVAWKKLCVEDGLPYPSSALFAAEVWKGKLTVALCEANPQTADEIDSWIASSRQQNRLQHGVLLRGDWRANLRNPLLINSAADCIYFEMDPMRYDIRPRAARRSTESATLYPDDIESVVQHLPNTIPVVLQVSSFSTQNNIMPLDDQKRSLEGILLPAGFALLCDVRVMQQMASFVFVKNCQIQVPTLGASFAKWLDEIE